jgi:ribonucleoside-diphosphate reductase alpha chain
MEHISFHAVEASAALARERGSYGSFEGSAWSQGKVVQDTWGAMGRHVRALEIPGHYQTPTGETKPTSTLLETEGFHVSLDWERLRGEVKAGMRNSLCLAIAPTATISNIAGCCQSIEPSYKNLYVKSNLGGDYTIINEYLVDELKSRKLWDASFARELKRADGSVSNFDLPAETKELFQTAFDIEPEQLIRCAASRQLYIDQSQSLNLYLGAPSGRKLDEMYRYAWHAGLKTTYYLRTKAATGVEKSSLKASAAGTSGPGVGVGGVLGASAMAASAATAAATSAALLATAEAFQAALQDVAMDGEGAKQCAIDNPDCEACQ